MESKCLACICSKCRIEFKTVPAECLISDCEWCFTNPLEGPLSRCSGYIDKGGTYGRRAR